MLSREESEHILSKIAAHGYPWLHELNMLRGHDAEQRQMIQQLTTSVAALRLEYDDHKRMTDACYTAHALCLVQLGEREAELSRCVTIKSIRQEFVNIGLENFVKWDYPISALFCVVHQHLESLKAEIARLKGDSSCCGH